MDAENKEFTEDEIILLKEIDELFNLLKNEPRGQIEFIGSICKVSSMNKFRYVRNAYKLKEKVFEFDNYNRVTLNRTLNKEVDLVDRAKDIKGKDKEKLEGLMIKATSQIRLDIFDILQRIVQMKEQE